MDILLASLTAVLLSFQGIIYKIYGKKCVSVGKTNDYLLNLLNFGVGLLVLIPLSLIGQNFDVKSFGLGLINGIIFCSMLVLYNKALQLGKIAFVNFISGMAMLIPLFGGVLLFNETISIIQYVGLAIILIAAYLVSSGQKNKDEDNNVDKKRAVKFWVLSLLCMICNGGQSLYIKGSYIFYPEINQSQYLLASFTMSFFAMCVFTAFTTKGFQTVKEYVPNKWFIICGILVGIVTILGNIAFTYFSVISSGAIFYPVTGALPMIIGTIVSPIFKEKLSKITIAGIIVGVVAIILLNL